MPRRKRFVQPATRITTVRELEALAEHVFGNKNDAMFWLQTRNLATDQVPPRELLDTPEGLNRVANLLLRIEYGVLA